MVLDVRCLGRLCRFDEICGLVNCGPATRRKVADGASLDGIWEPPHPTSTQHRRRHPLEADLISLTRNVRTRLVLLGWARRKMLQSSKTGET